ncbi:MAG: protein-L-isoaspartate(D-aspartate) O-methyltransferase [Candidatus Brockarchaeota archaeon]|nr:protein-L-isoaspartate(D-aspartate) O-methyltransferase [Candidatus Brockarchaeota archaeon]
MGETVGRDPFLEKRRRMVEQLVAEGVVKSERVREAMLRVPRHEFVWPNQLEYAYADIPLPLGDTGQTISAPHMVAIMNELLDVQVGDRILEVGTGSGYHAATLAVLTCPSLDSPSPLVYTVEINSSLVRFAESNFMRLGFSRVIRVIQGDGSKGYPEASPYDRILVTAAAPKIPPPLIEQLKPGGRMVIPVQSRFFEQNLVLLEKDVEGRVRKSNAGPVIFVPLRGDYGF